jgi:hypothetical protein
VVVCAAWGFAVGGQAGSADEGAGHHRENGSNTVGDARPQPVGWGGDFNNAGTVRDALTIGLADVAVAQDRPSAVVSGVAGKMQSSRARTER